MTDPADQFIAKASTTIDAPAATIWDALVDPEMIKQYMFGTNVVTDWKEGSEIVWRGEWDGRTYEDKGVILRIEPGRLLGYTHYSPLSGQPDTPENYHTVTIGLSGDGPQTVVTLTQDNNEDEQAREHSEANWQAMLEGLKNLLEK
jgi:uncharacterized protein YndB with AHSA1/START domain